MSGKIVALPRLQVTLKYDNAVVSYMISAFTGGLSELIKRPLFFVPALLGMLLNALILMLALGSYQAIFFGAVISGDAPDAQLIAQPYYFLANNLADSAIIALALLGTIIVGTLLLFTYAKMLTAKKTGIAAGVAWGVAAGAAEVAGRRLLQRTDRRLPQLPQH